MQIIGLLNKINYRFDLNAEKIEVFVCLYLSVFKGKNTFNNLTYGRQIHITGSLTMDFLKKYPYNQILTTLIFVHFQKFKLLTKIRYPMNFKHSRGNVKVRKLKLQFKGIRRTNENTTRRTR